MKASQLRASILQQAVEGKLVPQKPEEGSASDLLDSIKAEREALIKAGKIKKSKPLPEITEDEIPFEIPESWQWVRLGDITYNFGQKVPDKEFTYIDVASINNHSGCLKEELSILQPNQAPVRARKIVQNGCVIYSTVRPYLLNICVIEQEFYAEPIVSTAFAVLNPFNGVVNRYLYYYLRSSKFIDYVNDKSSGMAYPAISEAELYKGLIPLPPLAEQKRIVAKVEELMQVIDKLYSE